MATSYSIDYGYLASPRVPLAEDETDFGKFICAPLHESLPVLTRRLLAAEKRVDELQARIKYLEAKVLRG